MGSVSPMALNVMLDISAESEVGRSGRSTSIKIVADCVNCPDEVVPTAVTMNVLQAMSVGIVMEKPAGTEVTRLVDPIGPSPMIPTCRKEALEGEVTDAVMVRPGFTTVPVVGDVI